jgi:isoleucyl-tRNA synthetase
MRRSAQSALWHITHSLLRLLAPVLSFTADEGWGHFTRRGAGGASGDSVFFHTVYALPAIADAEQLVERWAGVRETRAEVQKELESLRTKGSIGSPLAAEVEVHEVSERYRALAELGNDLRFVLITSQASAREVADPARRRIVVRPSADPKCPRCWHYRADVGVDAAHPELCGRCVANLFGDGEPRTHA